MSAPLRVLVTCEHGGRDVPSEYRALFRGREALLASHRGWDPGALDLARALARALGAPLRLATVTRLLVDLNRSSGNRSVLSELTRPLAPAERLFLLERYHEPYRTAVRGDVAGLVRQGGRVLHLSVHTFTPVLRGVVRRTDVGLLYDPARPGERALAAVLAADLERRLPGSVVRRNHPYRGASDGLTTALRRVHPDADYLGLEIEVSQRLLDGRGRVPARVARALAEAVEDQRRPPR